MWVRLRLKEATTTFPNFPADEELVFNLDQVVAWKGHGDDPAELLLTSGGWVKVHTTAKMMEVLTGTHSTVVDAAFEAKGSK